MSYNNALRNIAVDASILSDQQEYQPAIYHANTAESRTYQVASATLDELGIGAYGNAGTCVYVGTENHPHLHPLNDTYVFNQPSLDRLISVALAREWERRSSEPRRGIVHQGPKGVGKSSYFAQRLARQGIPCAQLTWNPSMCAADAVYSRSIINGTTVVEQGVLWQAAEGGYPVVIDEINLAQPAEMASLNDLIDRGMYVVPETGEVIQAKRGFMIFATCNGRVTDSDGDYAGTRNQNIATMSRFWKYVSDYPTYEEEVAFIKAMSPDIADVTANAYAGFVQLVHAACGESGHVDNGTAKYLSLDFGRRELIDWLDLSDRFAYLADRGENVPLLALEPVYTAALSDAEKQTVVELLALAVSQAGA